MIKNGAIPTAKHRPTDSSDKDPKRNIKTRDWFLGLRFSNTAFRITARTPVANFTKPD